MKPTLPICIASVPDSTTSPELWRQIAPILVAIAEREKRNEDLYPSERTAYNAIAFAQYQASRRQWLNLWQYLLDRQVLQIGDIAAPPPKPKRDRPTKPPKNKVEKVPKTKVEKVPKPPKPPKPKKVAKLKKAPKQPKPKKPKVKKVKIYKPRKSLKGIKLENIRIVTTEQLQAALTIKWLDIVAITNRFKTICGVELTLDQTADLLNNRVYTGEIYKMPKGIHDAAFYSKTQAVEIDAEYFTDHLSLNMAYQLAQKRGYPFTKKAFGNASIRTLDKFGISYKPRKEMGDLDNKLLNYSDKWRDTKS